MNKLNKIAVAIALTTTLIAGQAFAAEQGLLDSVSSTGKSDITLQIIDQVQITEVDDIALGAFNGTDALTGSAGFCVYRNGGNGYSMTVTVQGETSFVAQSLAASDSVAFTVKVDGDDDASDQTAFTYGATSSTYNGSSLLDCGPTDNASIEVNFTASDLRAATTATDYKATLVVLVKPV